MIWTVYFLIASDSVSLTFICGSSLCLIYDSCSQIVSISLSSIHRQRNMLSMDFTATKKQKTVKPLVDLMDMFPELRFYNLILCVRILIMPFPRFIFRFAKLMFAFAGRDLFLYYSHLIISCLILSCRLSLFGFCL